MWFLSNQRGQVLRAGSCDGIISKDSPLGTVTKGIVAAPGRSSRDASPNSLVLWLDFYQFLFSHLVLGNLTWGTVEGVFPLSHMTLSHCVSQLLVTIMKYLRQARPLYQEKRFN
jgi:hypothetical protein